VQVADSVGSVHPALKRGLSLGSGSKAPRNMTLHGVSSSPASQIVA
jgi:hypothetical protein